VGDDSGDPDAIKQSLPGCADHPGDFKRVVWMAGRRARGGEIGFSVLRNKAGWTLAM